MQTPIGENREEEAVSDDQLVAQLYDELRRLAGARMAQEKPGQTLQATALVHEAWIRLLGPDGNEQAWGSRGHFFAAAAEAMKRILIERARKKGRVKHGGEWKRVDFDSLDLAETLQPDALLCVGEAIEKLAAEDAEAARMVNLRFYIGLEMTEIAKAMGISERAAYRLWAFARAWLFKELNPAS